MFTTFDLSLPWMDQMEVHDPQWWEWENHAFKYRLLFMFSTTPNMNKALDEIERSIAHLDPSEYHIEMSPVIGSVVVYVNEENLDWMALLKLHTEPDGLVQSNIMGIEKFA